MEKDPTHLLWFDFETTGLWKSPTQPPALMQIGGVLLPFGKLNDSDILWSFEFDFGIRPWQAEQMIPFVRDMHARSGLTERCLTSTMTPAKVQTYLLERLKASHVEPQCAAFAGSGIAPFDVPLVREYMFDLYQFMQYAPFDLGTGRRTLRMLGVKQFDQMPSHQGGHTSLADVQAQLEQARWMKAKL